MINIVSGNGIFFTARLVKTQKRLLKMAILIWHRDWHLSIRKRYTGKFEVSIYHEIISHIEHLWVKVTTGSWLTFSFVMDLMAIVIPKFVQKIKMILSEEDSDFQMRDHVIAIHETKYFLDD
ncbi:hypothetical protein ACJX0J_031666 [Zea mays]